jgi:EpsI family protein
LIPYNARFAVVAVLVAGTGLFLQARARHHFVPSRIALSSFPKELKGWIGIDVPLPAETLKSLGPGEFLQRTYKNQRAGNADVDLYLAYFQNRDALYKHLPQDCLIGSGWSPLESGTTTLAFPGEPPFPANRYLIARGDDHQLVLFWYSAHGRRLASENQLDFALDLDSLISNRTDSALVRMNTELKLGENPAAAEQRLLAFAGLVNPILYQYLPR